MWKAEAGHVVEQVKITEPKDEDEWETGDVTPVSEKEQRWGRGKEVHIDVPLQELVEKTKQKHDNSRINEYSQDSFARGYGGKFGVTTTKDHNNNQGQNKEKSQEHKK